MELQGQKREVLGRLPAFDDGLTIMRTISDKSGNAPSLRALQVTAGIERRNAFIGLSSRAEISAGQQPTKVATLCCRWGSARLV